MKNENSNELGGHKDVLLLTINNKKYEWPNQYINGHEVKELAHIEKEDQLFLKIKAPWEDELISDETKVDLARPGIEHFFSIEKHKEITIIVNGSLKKWDKHQISLKDLIIIAFGHYDENPNTVYTVTYEDGPKQNIEGSMIKNSVVFVKDKMIFHATATDKS